MTNEHARLIRAFTAAMEDALRAAGSIAHRAGDTMNGEPGTMEFYAAATAIGEFSDHPAMLALKSIGVPPSLKGRPTDGR